MANFSHLVLYLNSWQAVKPYNPVKYNGLQSQGVRGITILMFI